MENKKEPPRKALGRGLSSLIKPPSIPELAEGTGRRHLDREVIRPNPFQPRKTFDENSLAELAKSIELHGIVQPIVVRQAADHYQIVAGERRWRAAAIAGVRSIPVIVQNFTDDQLLEIGLIENVQREDLNPMDLATAYAQLRRRLGNQP